MPGSPRLPLWAGRTAPLLGILLVAFTQPPILFAALLVGSVIAFAGTGIGNVLLPSIVRRYFPDRVALLAAVHACIVGVSTAVPAAFAAPVAEQFGWRFSLGVWSLTSVTALVPRLLICTYAAFAWLPEILGDIAGSTPTEAGVLLIGSGSILFPVSLVLINVRTRTNGGTIALSGFAQGVAYALGALGPLLVGLFHDVSGGWTLPLLFLLTVALVAIIPAITLAEPAFVEDELAR